MSELSTLPGEPYDLCIIGGGISGLCLARLASGRQLRTLVLERRSEAGGCLATAPVGDAGWLELGAHTCYNSYAQFLDIMAATDFLSRAVPRKSMGFRLVERGRLRSIMSCLGLWEAAFCLPRAFREPKAGQSAQAYYSRILGAGNWARVMHPMLNAVASQETAGFPADALFKKRGRRRKDVVKSFAVRGGLGPAVQALAALPGIRCAVDREAAEVARAGDGFTVRTVQGDLIHARRVAVAAPADAASRMLAAGFPGLSAQLAKIETRTVKSLGVVFDDPLPRLPRLTGLVLPEGPCYSALSADTFPVPGKRAWAFHFDGARAGTEQEMLACACQVLGAAPAAVAATFRRDHSMPSIAMGHGDWLAEVDRSLPATGLLLVGNYLSGLSIEDCAGRARREFDRVLG